MVRNSKYEWTSLKVTQKSSSGQVMRNKKMVFFSLEGISPLFIATNLIHFIHAAKKFRGLLWKLAKYGSKIKIHKSYSPPNFWKVRSSFCSTYTFVNWVCGLCAKNGNIFLRIHGGIRSYLKSSIKMHRRYCSPEIKALLSRSLSTL